MTTPTNPPLLFPDLETERLKLRQLTLDDTQFIFQHFSDPLVTQYLMDEPPLTSEDEARAIINFFQNPETKNHNRWGMERKSDHRLIGTIGFHCWEKAYHRCDLGYDLCPDCWGQGYMSEALKVVLRSGFDRMDLHRVDAYVYTGNPRSYGLLEKFGFRKEGLLRDYFYLNGAYYDHYFYGLLRQDWEASPR